jgi:hypothetical protein
MKAIFLGGTLDGKVVDVAKGWQDYHRANSSAGEAYKLRRLSTGYGPEMKAAYYYFRDDQAVPDEAWTFDRAEKAGIVEAGEPV